MLCRQQSLKSILLDRQFDRARSLFAKLEAQAAQNTEVQAQLNAWLETPSTTTLRDLLAPFGDYWSDIRFQNLVDQIDTASLDMDALASATNTLRAASGLTAILQAANAQNHKEDHQ